MSVLLDTHAFLWAVLQPHRLSKKVADYLMERNRVAYLSAASIWEISIKCATGKLPQLPNPVESIETAISDLMLNVLPIRLEHSVRVFNLPDHHKDPFDRMLVAQAIVERAAIATADTAIMKYAVDIFW